MIAPVVLNAQAVVPLPSTTLPLTHEAQPTSPAISAKDLMTRLYIFADDSMQGREAGTIGNFKGTDYIAREAARMRLVPAGDNGTYFQNLPLKTRETDSASTLAIGGVALMPGIEWRGTGLSLSQSNLPVVYGGNLGDSASLISADKVAGKLVLFGLPSGRAMFSAFRNIATSAHNATAVAVVVPPPFLSYLGRPAQFIDDPSAMAVAPKPVIFVTAASASKFFDTPIGQLRAGADGKPVTVDLRVTTSPVTFPARNVVAILPGSDPKVRGEFVAIGAHNDHIGFNHQPVDHDSLRIFNHIVRPGGAEDAQAQATPEQQAEADQELTAWRAAHPGTTRLDSTANGADDDGSGSVSVLEIAEKLASRRQPLKRSVLFVWHEGEEKGLLGSAYFTDHPTVPRDSIDAQLNIDMVGRGDAWDQTGRTKDGRPLHGSPNYLQLVGSRRLSTELGDLIERVNTEDKHGLAFDYSMDANGHPMNIYCRSDHYEYARYGIPITFFTTGGHSDYHQVTDEPEYIDYAHMARVDNLIADVAVHIANLSHRIVVDRPKPDPHGVCRQ